MKGTQEDIKAHEERYTTLAVKVPANDAAISLEMIRDFIRLTSKHKELVWKFCRCIREGEEARHEKD